MTPGQPDPTVIRRHLVAIDEAVRRLRAHLATSQADLAADDDRRWAVERGLQLSAQNALDIATHLAAGSGHDVSDYASAIDRLGDLGILHSMAQCPNPRWRNGAIAQWRNGAR